MDKTDFRKKRQQDKFHKKAPPQKPNKQPAGPPKTSEVQHTAPLIVCDQRYGKRQLQQNWTEDRDRPCDDSESEDEQLNAADFETLLSVPPSTSGHFLLSSEKHWLAPETGLIGDDHKNRFSEYFRIDTKLLNASLKCIPFYERHGYDQGLFNADELNLMRQKAEIQTSTYNTLTKRQDTHSEMDVVKPSKPVPCLVGKNALPKAGSEQPKSIDRPIVNPSQRPEGAPTVGVEARIADLTIDASPIVKTMPASPSSSSVPRKPIHTAPPTGKETKEDIQQWLDDILDI
ncbi:uncharacterized protein LOC131284429 [Anopheles ziemanni]|uniref:uncharacterized protein LOC131258624 n=1 Tax=Anopheles coustani TaxID=139045 RepID=UPI00265A0189|nr:uncharacterized protein LOC131258624 [Anopheles coustani]XP_058169270.1 uncharacterized protein LOC131284429 [Anopheles ziemanni]